MTKPNAQSGEDNSHPDSLEVSRSWLDGVAILALRGELDVLTAPLLIDALGQVLVDMPTALIVDLSQVDFLASAGMGALITAHERAGPTVRFGVVADGPATSRPMTLIGLDQTLPLYPTLDDALRDAR